MISTLVERPTMPRTGDLAHSGPVKIVKKSVVLAEHSAFWLSRAE